MTCLKCGQVGHRAANCTKERAHAAEDQSAPFVCYAEQALLGGQGGDNRTPTTAEAVRAGWGVIDGGATRTLGSVQAIEAVMKVNEGKHGKTGVQSVDLQNRPIFGFADSGEAKCVSTIDLGLRAGGQDGMLRVHALDKGSGPILVSVATLRALGAIIDFEKDLLVLRKLVPTKLIHLQRSTTGHQLVNLTDDLFQDATPATKAVPGSEIFAERVVDCAKVDSFSSGAVGAQKFKQSSESADVKALDYLYANVESCGRDVVGFGRHASLTYAELVQQYPRYAEWVTTTHKETEETNPRLKRLAGWLMRATDVSEPVRRPTTTQDPQRLKLKIKGGYLTEPEVETPPATTAASSGASPYPAGQMELMATMMETMKSMQEELKEIRQMGPQNDERPRKKVMSSHKRLLEQMDLPCHVEYTEDYARFGCGEVCTCGESKIRDFHMTCGNCISGREELEFQTDEEKQQAETMAAKLTKEKKYGIQEIQPLLELMSQLRIGVME
ncbi:unnamed protein product [Symbiodinium necroappetens]|uniref:CCHC-type domain-containing protein n=1 Tax=Symbiodinium necroappetens TaxID=1628268 RepID=A0A812LVG9_9DINO|nr:unnamed protein product [Symbiodinium necroappetens]